MTRSNRTWAWLPNGYWRGGGHLPYCFYAVQTKPEAAAHKLPAAFNSNFELNVKMLCFKWCDLQHDFGGRGGVPHFLNEYIKRAHKTLAVWRLPIIVHMTGFDDKPGRFIQLTSKDNPVSVCSQAAPLEDAQTVVLSALFLHPICMSSI